MGNKLKGVHGMGGTVRWSGGSSNGAVGRRLVQQGEPGGVDVEATVQFDVCMVLLVDV